MGANEERSVILVVDDDWLVRAATVELVEAAGFTAIDARNADQAIGLLETRPDIRMVITDVDMPGSMDGIELVKVIRERWPPVLLVIVSGLSDLHERAVIEGVQVFGKPYADQELTRHLLAMLV